MTRILKIILFEKFLILFFFLFFQSSIEASSKVLVYGGRGACAMGVHSTLSMLRYLLPKKIAVQEVDSASLKKGALDSAALFVLPGGVGSKYRDEFSGEINHRIRGFVNQGGSYFGICAGAYYAGSEVHFAAKTPQAIHRYDQLGLFKGMVIGPSIAPYFYNSLKGARATTLHSSKTGTGTANSLVYYNGGGHFISDAEITPKPELVASYNPDEVDIEYKIGQNIFPAIIQVPFGLGKVVLSSVHLEISAKDLEPFRAQLPSDVLENLSDSGVDESRLELQSEILGRLLRL